MKASKPILSLHSRHITTQEEYINGITDVDGVNGDNRRQLAVLRLALDDVVITQLLVLTCAECCTMDLFVLLTHIAGLGFYQTWIWRRV